jgi:hypothetical protein
MRRCLCTLTPKSVHETGSLVPDRLKQSKKNVLLYRYSIHHSNFNSHPNPSKFRNFYTAGSLHASAWAVVGLGLAGLKMLSQSIELPEFLQFIAHEEMGSPMYQATAGLSAAGLFMIILGHLNARRYVSHIHLRPGGKDLLIESCSVWKNRYRIIPIQEASIQDPIVPFYKSNSLKFIK